MGGQRVELRLLFLQDAEALAGVGRFLGLWVFGLGWPLWARVWGRAGSRRGGGAGTVIPLVLRATRWGHLSAAAGHRIVLEGGERGIRRRETLGRNLGRLLGVGGSRSVGLVGEVDE